MLLCADCPVYLPCPGFPVLAVKFLLSCSFPLFPSSLTYTDCPGWHVLAVQSRLSCLGCPVLAILSQLSCPGCPVPTVLFLLSYSGHPLLSVLSTLTWSGWPVCRPVQTDLPRLFCPKYSVPAVSPWLSCPWLSYPWMSYQGCAVSIVLSKLSCPIKQKVKILWLCFLENLLFLQKRNIMTFRQILWNFAFSKKLERHFRFNPSFPSRTVSILKTVYILIPRTALLENNVGFLPVSTTADLWVFIFLCRTHGIEICVCGEMRRYGGGEGAQHGRNVKIRGDRKSRPSFIPDSWQLHTGPRDTAEWETTDTHRERERGEGGGHGQKKQEYVIPAVAVLFS